MKAPATCNFKPLRKLNWVFSVLFIALLWVDFGFAKSPFRISISEIPKSLDPHLLRSSSGQYVSQQIYRHFYRLDAKNNFVPELGESCSKKKTKWVCTVKESAKWSDGSDLTATDFVESFKSLLQKPSPRADLLFGIKNARAISQQKVDVQKLGVRVVDRKKFEIEWEKNEIGDDFILMSPLLVPLPNGKWKENLFSGPFKIDQITNLKIEMSPNPYYFKPAKVKVHWLLFDEGLTVQAFEKKELDFLRRVPTSMIQALRNRPEFFDSPVVRMDALFFGPDLAKELNFRSAVIEHLDYSQMQTLFNSKTRPGCVGVPLDFYEGPEVCYQNKTNTKLDFKNPPKNMAYTYSALGGEDHRRLAEWLQAQFQSLFKVLLQVRGLENKIFLDQVKKTPTAIFRRGLSPENPSCFGILESFRSDHPDNLSQIKNAQFDQILAKLKGNQKSKSLCRQALVILMDQKMMIPTGRIFFSYLINRRFQGLELNLLNHMDLAGLSQGDSI